MAFTDFAERARTVKVSFTMILNLICWLMRDNNCVFETTQHKLPMDPTHKLCKTDMINMNDIQLLNTSESFAPDFWCHVEYKIILYCHRSRMVNEKLSFILMFLINYQLRQIISAFC